RSPHIIGLEWPRPGISFFHRIFSDFSTFQVVGVADPFAIPLALSPRNEGQLVCASTRQASVKIVKTKMAWRKNITEVKLVNHPSQCQYVLFLELAPPLFLIAFPH